MGINKILVVDDEPLVIWAIKSKFDKAGYFTESASNVQNAIDLIQKNQYDLVITDLKLPDKDGLEIIQKTKNQLPSAKIFRMRAFGTENNKRKSMELGADLILDKPLDLNKLLSTIEFI